MQRAKAGINFSVKPEKAISLMSVGANHRETTEREQWFSSLLDGVNVAVLAVDLQGAVTFVNSSALKLLRCGSSDIIGSAAKDVLHLHQERTGGEKVNLIDEVLKTNIPVGPNELYLVSVNGSVVPVECTASPIRDSRETVTGVTIVCRDITPKKLAEESLKFMRFAFDRAADAIFWADSEKRFIYVNDAACDQLGYTRDEMLEMRVPDISVKHDPDRFKERWEHLKQTHHVQYESLHRHKSGSLIPIEISLNLLQYEGQTFTCGMVRDISDRKSAQKELAETQKKLIETARHVGMAEVATSVLHNVGNVLNSVNVSAALISDKVHKFGSSDFARATQLLQENRDNLGAFITDDQRGQHLPDFLIELSQHMTCDEVAILEEVDSLRKNIEHIKTIVSLQQSHAGVSGLLEEVSLAEPVEDAIQINIASMTRHKIVIDRQFEKMPTVTINAQKFMQIVVNLIANAKYAIMHNDCNDGQVTIRISSSGELACVEVIDNGHGIPQENLGRIFAHGFTTRKEGHGFGLHSAALAAKEMGGTLVASSDGPGKGAKFRLEFPIHAERLKPCLANTT